MSLSSISDIPSNRSFTKCLRKISQLASTTNCQIDLYKDTELERKVIVKKLQVEDSGSRSKEKLLNEHSMINSFNHKNIIRCYGGKFVKERSSSTNQVNERLWLEMEYAKGGDLCSKIKEHKKNGTYMAEHEIMHYFVQACLGLCQIHNKNIMHRDIKSQNMFINHKNMLKVGDFGTSRTVDQANFLTTFIGTPLYLAPEVVDMSYNLKADIWSLGVTLYEM